MSQPGIDYIGVGVGAIILSTKGKILLGQRGELSRSERGMWEIPGGAVEFGETFEDALTREVREEIGVEIEIIQFFQMLNHIIPEEKQHWVSPTYLCRIVAGSPRIMEPGKCDQLRWCTIDEAKQLPLSIVTQQDIDELSKKSVQKLLHVIHGVDLVKVEVA